MTKFQFSRILATTALCLAAGTCEVHADASRVSEAVPLHVAHQTSLSMQAEEVFLAFTLFPSSELLKKLVNPADGEVEEELLAMARAGIAAIRPCCEMLRTMPPERVKELMLLADAVLWQSQWLSNVYMGEFGVECEYPFDVGLLELSHSTKIVKEVLKGEKEVSPEVASLLRELVEQVGGEQVLDYPATWYDEQLAEDYKTALQFYKDFCAAATAETEAQAIALLKEQEEVMAYFVAKGEGEIWRVNKLAFFFHATLLDLQWEHKCAPYSASYSEPILPQEYRTAPRLKALQPFIETFPALRELLDL